MKCRKLIRAADMQRLAAIFPMYALKHIGNTCRKTLKKCPLNRHELIFALSVSALFAPGTKPNFVKRCAMIAEFFASQKDGYQLEELFACAHSKNRRRKNTKPAGSNESEEEKAE